ncbi:MAG: PDZ domain-containing protein [Gemmatimonadetes bacterium]|nr:PDZ domain-containing protein [Gemmatimonadota bacterium]
MRTVIRGLIALGAVTVAGGAAASVSPALGAQTVRIVDRTSARADSVIDRLLVADVQEVKRVVAAWREREGQLVREIRAAGAADAKTRQRLEEQLALHTRDGFALMSAVQARCMDERVPRPAGYLGVNLTIEYVMENERPKSMGTVVTSVEPGSPAERAGVQRNDKVISIAGLDMRERVPDLSEQLVPGRNIVVRVERQGAPREFSVNVARRPEGFGESCGEFERALMPMRFPGSGRIVVQEPGTESRRVLVETRETAPRRESAPDPGAEVRLFIFNPGAEDRTAVGFFAGAEFSALDADWGEVLGVRQGVIVNKVADGSSAAQAGLKSGDVITALGRTPVASPVTLVQMLGSMDGTEATLSVVRRRERKTVTLRWGPR